MRTSGSSVGRLGLAALFLMALVSAAVAAQVFTVEIPAGADAYVVTATLVPGSEGAEVLGDRGDGHVQFRVGFGSDLRLSVNGADAGTFNPLATYVVTVSCQRVGNHWFASTVVSNGAGQAVFSQANYKMPEAATEALAAAPEVDVLNVE